MLAVQLLKRFLHFLDVFLHLLVQVLLEFTGRLRFTAIAEILKELADSLILLGIELQNILI